MYTYTCLCTSHHVSKLPGQFYVPVYPTWGILFIWTKKDLTKPSAGLMLHKWTTSRWADWETTGSEDKEMTWSQTPDSVLHWEDRHAPQTFSLHRRGASSYCEVNQLCQSNSLVQLQPTTWRGCSQTRITKAAVKWALWIWGSDRYRETVWGLCHHSNACASSGPPKWIQLIKFKISKVDPTHHM